MLKYKIYVFLILLTAIFFTGIISASKNDLNLLGKVIYLDPGHGGIDPGTIYKDLKEKDINLQISNILAKQLEKKGAIVYLTRYHDYDLSINNNERKKSDLRARVNLINDSKCDLYLSIHLNSEGSEIWRGAQVFYDDINNSNLKLAKIIQKEFNNNLNSDRKIKEIKNIYLNRRVKQPGVLLEIGFLSNPSDRYLLQKKDYQLKIANTIVDGVNKYFN